MVTLVLDIVQQLLDAEPVNNQHTWITVLATTPSVRLARLGEMESSVTLRVQGIAHEDLASLEFQSILVQWKPL